MKSDTGDLAALRAGFQAVGEPAANNESCPQAEAILQAVEGELSPTELRTVVEHTASCAACAEDWRIAAAYVRELGAQTAAPRAATSGWRRWALPAAAAVALVAVGLAWFDGPHPADRDPVYRDQRPAVLRSLVAEGTTLPADAFVLRWEAVPGATAYEVQILTEALDPVTSAKELAAPELRIPASSLAALPSGSLLYWQVTARQGDGSRLVSPTFAVRLR